MESTTGWRGPAADWAPVAAVAAVGTLGLGRELEWAGSNALLAALSLALSLPLAWRRTRPLAVAVAVGGVLVVQRHVFEASLDLASLCAVLIVIYSAARHQASPRRALAAPAVLAGLVLTARIHEIAAAPTDLVYPLFYFTGTWLLGRAIRTHAEQAEQLGQLNEALRRERESSIALALAEQRLDLSRDLHDVIGHSLTLMIVQAGAAEDRLDSDPGAARGSLLAVQDAGRRSMAELRELVSSLRTSEPDDLASVLDRFRRAGLTVEVHGSGDPDPLVARIVGEGLTNVLRHSTATTARVDLATDRAGRSISVTDPGPRRPEPGTGHGLALLGDRLTEHGGVLEAGEHGDGYRLHARLPLGCA